MDCDDIPTNKEEFPSSQLIDPLSSHDKEKLRLIGQELKYLGLHSTLSELSRESGVIVEHPVVIEIQQYIMDAHWNDAYHSTQLLIDVVEAPIVEKIQYLILKRKFHELLQARNFSEAFYFMRADLAKSASADILDIARLLVTVGVDPEEQDAPEMRQKLIFSINDILPYDIIVPPLRLRTLLQQSTELQMRRCLYHNKDLKSDDFHCGSLFVDHSCPQDSIPTERIEQLQFSDEVLSVQFSHDGCYLAAGTIDCNLIVFNVDNVNFKLTRKHVILCSSTDDAPISSLCWHSTGKYLLCAVASKPANFVILFDMETASCRRITFNCDVQLVTWDTINSEQFFAGGRSGTVVLSNIHGNTVFTHQGYRAVGLHCLRTGIVIIADSYNRIVSYNLINMLFEVQFQEDNPIVSIEFDSREEYIALSMINSSITLWDFRTKTKLYTHVGAVINKCVVKASIGGYNQSFIASGSEDGTVYIWNHTKYTRLKCLPGHMQMVNAVHWNPSNPMMLASCSDDEFVIIWGPDKSKIPC